MQIPRPQEWIHVIILTGIMLFLSIFFLSYYHADAIRGYIIRDIPILVEGEVGIDKLLAEVGKYPYVNVTTLKKITAAELLDNEVEESIMVDIDEDLLPMVQFYIRHGDNLPALEVIQRELELNEFIDKVYVPDYFDYEIRNIIQWLQFISLVLGLGLGILFFIIMVHNIRLIIFDIRDQLRILDLVGGSRRFMLWPVLKRRLREGLAATILFALIIFLIAYFKFPFLIYEWEKYTEDLIAFIIIAIVVGFLINFIISYFTALSVLRRERFLT